VNTTERTKRDLTDWPATARVAYVLSDGDETLELVIGDDGYAALDGRGLLVLEHVRVAELRAGRAAVRAGRI
jgi:hypothetical protein